VIAFVIIGLDYEALTLLGSVSDTHRSLTPTHLIMLRYLILSNYYQGSRCPCMCPCFIDYHRCEFVDFFSLIDELIFLSQRKVTCDRHDTVLACCYT